jgi:hypothetical protein
MLLAVVALGGCPESDDSTPPPPPPPPTAATTAAPSATLEPADTSNKPAASANPNIEAKIKAELDGKDPNPGHTVSLAVTGAKATFTAPTGWKTTKSGVFTVSTSADDKTRFAAGSDADPASKLNDAATALGLTECEWASPEPATVGADKLPANVADGLCKRSGASVKAGYAIFTGDGLNMVSMGAWDAGGDAAGMFNTFRTAKKAGTGDATGIAACCAALRGNAASAPPEQKGAYLAAAGACQAVITNPQGRQALAQVRALLAGANVPASCK